MRGVKERQTTVHDLNVQLKTTKLRMVKEISWKSKNMDKNRATGYESVGNRGRANTGLSKRTENLPTLDLKHGRKWVNEEEEEEKKRTVNEQKKRKEDGRYYNIRDDQTSFY